MQAPCPRTSDHLSEHSCYSPDLNPVENVWQYLRANWLAISVFDDYDAIVDACCRAWNRFANDPDIVASITSRQRAKVNA
jgi:putative transposase